MNTKIVLSLMLIGLMLSSFVSVVMAENNETTSIGNESTNKQDIEDNLISSEKNTPQTSQGKLLFEINPEKIMVEAGQTAEYTLTIADLHYPMTCSGGECALFSYNYKLDIQVSDKVNYEFSEKEISLSAGEKTQVKLKLTSNEKEAYIFVVKIKGEDIQAKARAMFIVNGGVPVDSSFFIGSGFALSEDESEGKIVDLKILNNENKLSGKMLIDNNVYKISGDLIGQNLKFQIFDMQNQEAIGSFSGNYKKFPNFLLLRGNLNLDGKYKLTAISENKIVFNDIEVSKEQNQTTKIKKGNIIVISKPKEISGSNETYIRAVEIEKQKILGFLPNPIGKKVVQIEIMNNGHIEKKNIGENQVKEFKEYKIKASNLDDENNIELEISKKEA